MSRSAALQELERRIEDVENRPSIDVETVPTGLVALDDVLPGGGLPRGRATEWLGPRSCGKMALLRQALCAIHDFGEPVAVVDAPRTLYAPDWVGRSERSTAFWIVRPPQGEAAWCADLLLRSGAFGAVVLDGAGLSPVPMRHGIAVRLQRLAEEAGSILIMITELPVAGLRLRFLPGRVRPELAAPFGPFIPPVRPVRVQVGNTNWVEIPVACPVPFPRGLVGRAFIRDRKGPL